MKEQPRFVPGDIAECVDSSGTDDLTEGKKYKILNTRREKCCGIITVDIGHDGSNYIAVCTCGAESEEDIYWYHQRRFAFPEEVTRWETEINSALKGIPETL